MTVKLKRVKDLNFGDVFQVSGPKFVRSGCPYANSYIPFYKIGDTRERSLHPDMVVAVNDNQVYIYSALLGSLKMGQNFRYRGVVHIVTNKKEAEIEVISSTGSLIYLPDWVIVAITGV